MRKIQLQALLDAGAVESLAFHGLNDGYELWVYAYCQQSSGDRYRTSLGDVRLWSSLDTLYKFVRDAGFSGRITISTSVL